MAPEEINEEEEEVKLDADQAFLFVLTNHSLPQTQGGDAPPPHRHHLRSTQEVRTTRLRPAALTPASTRNRWAGNHTTPRPFSRLLKAEGEMDPLVETAPS